MGWFLGLTVKRVAHVGALTGTHPPPHPTPHHPFGLRLLITKASLYFLRSSLWHFLYSVGPHPVSILHIYTFVVSRAFMAGVASQAGDADSSRTPGLTSGLQGSVNVQPGALLLVPQ